MNKQLPLVHKKMNGNDYEKIVFNRFPRLKEFMRNVGNGSIFQVDKNVLEIIETPGHRSDHISFSFKCIDT